jgi:hypothetical protein
MSGAGWYVFGCQTGPLPFVTLPIVVWAAVRLRVCGTVFATVTLSAVAVWCTAHGHGPFAGGRPVTAQVMLTQGFLVVATTLSLVLAALTMEWRTAAAESEAARRELLAVNGRLRRLATLDGLTGVYNRRAFQERLDEEEAMAIRSLTSKATLFELPSGRLTACQPAAHPEARSAERGCKGRPLGSSGGN